ncbi:MAG: TlpA family protein disulfide reductase, partial [Bacteroidales bacterium]|nr:TlpA family protein disulfide reductase [Bacteroidales bacterium]
MNTSLLLLLIPLLLFAGNRNSETEIPVVNFEEFQPLLEKDNDTLYVVNFWATWCAPCIKEIPYFEQLSEKYRDKKLKVLMVS